MPVRIAFEDPMIRFHLTTDVLRDLVIEDIRSRYNVGVREVMKVEQITLDPGGPAFSEEAADWVKFQIQENGFRLQAQHVPTIHDATINRVRIVETSDASLARLYLYYDVVVLPTSYLWVLSNHLRLNADRSVAAHEEMREVFRQANLRAYESNDDPSNLPSNVIPLFVDNKNVH